MKSFWKQVIILTILVLMALPLPIIAQTASDQEVQPLLSEEELTQLLAPVALYPDELLAQVLMASTYPLEIVMADRWVQRNKDLKGTALANALEKETWDPSVKSLVNFPSVLSMLSQKLDLTTKLGDAFLEQKEEVMDTVQLLREKAVAAGSLRTTPEQKVITTGDAVVIEPANPRVIYVPSYDPYVVYGRWWYPDYPPYYFYTPPYPGSIYFSYGYGISLGFAWGYAWGGWDWHDRNVIINVERNRFYNPYIKHRRYGDHFAPRGERARGERGRGGPVPWRHDPGHRRGVAYKGKETARGFGQLPGRRGEVRGDSRGFAAPGLPGKPPRPPGVGSDRRGGGAVQPPVPGQIGAPARGSGPPPPLPHATRESVFSGGDGAKARRSSERGRQSIDRGAVRQGAPAPAPVPAPRPWVNPGAAPDRDSTPRGTVIRPPESGGPRGGGFDGGGRGPGGGERGPGGGGGDRGHGGGGGGRGGNERR